MQYNLITFERKLSRESIRLEQSDNCITILTFALRIDSKMLWQTGDEDEKCNFDLLDDNCCYEILRCLPLDDLCALSQTCVRLFNLCSSQFVIDYPAKVMHIEGIAKDGKFKTGPSQEKYVTAFKKSIRNIVLHGKPLASKLNVVNSYYNQNESMKKLIKHIQLINWCKADFTNAGQTLVHLLENVETIIFDHVWIETDWYDTILKYTPNIKCLKVLYRCAYKEQQNWLDNVYPNLESLEHYALKQLEVDKLKSFLRSNPTVQHVSLYAELAEEVTDWIKNDVKVDELFYYVHTISSYGIFDFKYGIDFLKSKLAPLSDLCKVQNSKLHLMIGKNTVSEDELIAEITPLQSNIVGLYIRHIEIGEKLATVISTFENVRILLMASCKNKEVIARMLKLEELYFEIGFSNGNFDEMHETMRTFVGQSAKLKKMYIRNNRIPFTRFEFAKLDRERMKLNAACKLKIYINSKENDETGQLDDIRPTFSRIEIIRTATEPSNNPHLDRIHNFFMGMKADGLPNFCKCEIEGPLFKPGTFLSPF